MCLKRGFQLVFPISSARLAPVARAQSRLLSTTPSPSSEETDLLIVGSGAGALTANLTAQKNGLRTIIIEKQDTLGGSSAISGGALWIPCNPISARHGAKDTKEAALKYFAAAVGDVGPCSSLAKRNAFLDNGPRMIEFLQSLGFRFRHSKDYPDYYTSYEGSMGAGGRTIETRSFDMRVLGEWQGKFPHPTVPVPIYMEDARVIMRMMGSFSAFGHSMKVFLSLLVDRLAGKRMSTTGRGLVAQLLHLNLSHGSVDIRLGTALSRLIRDGKGRVTGAEVKSNSSTSAAHTIHASHGIVLAAGGFAHNQSMRSRYHPNPASTSWTSSPPGDKGDAIQEGIRIGADTALMDDAWWTPTIVDPVSGKNIMSLFERSMPHCFIVDSSGQRFMNEAMSYTDAGQAQYARHQALAGKPTNNGKGKGKGKGKAIPAWLILDTNHRRKYILGSLFPRTKPSKEALSKGLIFQADSITDLASQIGVDPAGLHKTTTAYNEMCKAAGGTDTSFGKGSSSYDRYFGDPTTTSSYHLNPNMGPVAQAPYYAVPIWPGDIGTKGGLLTDESQRVFDRNQGVVPGLFAIGNTAASIMGRRYLGAGATLGPAMVHGFIVGEGASQK